MSDIFSYTKSHAQLEAYTDDNNEIISSWKATDSLLLVLFDFGEGDFVEYIDRSSEMKRENEGERESERELERGREKERERERERMRGRENARENERGRGRERKKEDGRDTWR